MVSNTFSKAVLWCFVLVTYLNVFRLSAQDSLSQKDFKYLFSMIRKSGDKPSLQGIYLRSFLSKAKEDRNWELIVNGYKNYADYADEGLAIQYADSMVYTAGQSHSAKLIGSAYLSKGIVYYAHKRHEMALENYLISQPFIDKANDPYLLYKLKYNIGLVKYYLGKNKQAIEILKECLEYFRSENTRAYLNTIHAIGLCYNSAGNYGQSQKFVALGFKEGKRLDEPSMEGYFLHLDGQNDYFLKNYASAIDKLKTSLPKVISNGDHGNIAVGNFYIGKSYWATKHFGQAVPYLEKVAMAFSEKKYMRRDLRETFELLIQYHKKDNNYKKVLLYVDALLKADSLLIRTHDNLYDSIQVNYDTQQLLKEKHSMQRELSGERCNRQLLVVGSIGLSAVIIMLLIAYIRNKQRNNRIFKQLLLEKKTIAKPVKSLPKELGIAQETVDKILRLLEKWEANMRFLDTDITLTTLAVYLDTNNRYASDIILHYRGRKFSDYVNDLKVDYIIELLKTDRLKRMYTHEALAEEAGFSTTQRFVQAFKAKTGISPKFFSAKIRKEMAESDAQL